MLCSSWPWQGQPEHMVCELELLAGINLAPEGTLLLLIVPAALAVVYTVASTLLHAIVPATAWHSKAEAHFGRGGRKQLRCRDVHAALHVSCLFVHADEQVTLDTSRPGCKSSPGLDEGHSRC